MLYWCHYLQYGLALNSESETFLRNRVKKVSGTQFQLWKHVSRPPLILLAAILHYLCTKSKNIKLNFFLVHTLMKSATFSLETYLVVGGIVNIICSYGNVLMFSYWIFLVPGSQWSRKLQLFFYQYIYPTHKNNIFSSFKDTAWKIDYLG